MSLAIQTPGGYICQLSALYLAQSLCSLRFCIVTTTMLRKVLFSLLAFTACQVFASSLMARSSLEFLATRQTFGSCGSVCTPFEDALDACSTPACLCTVANTASLQACIDCGVVANPTTAVIQASQSLIETYKGVCAGVTLPTLTIPGVSTRTSTSATSTRVSQSTSFRSPSTVTSIDTLPPPNSPSVVFPTTTSSDTSPSGLPGGLNRSASSRTVATNAIIVTISTILGVALIFH